MRALDTCDFCGGDAIGTFEVIPETLRRSEADQRRAVLCESCRDRLSELLEPLHAGSTGSDEGNRSVTFDEPTSENVSDGGVTTNDSAAAESTSRNGSENEARAVHERSDDADPAGEMTSSATDAATTNADATTDEATTNADTAADAATTNADDTTDATTANADATTDAATANADTATDEATTNADSDDATANATTVATTGPVDGVSRSTYASVRKLLRNRDFPVERQAFVALAAGAYEVEEDAVEAILDHAVDSGDLVEDGPLLRRP